MGSNEGDGTTLSPEEVRDLQSKLAAALARADAAELRNADPPALPAGTSAAHALQPAGSGDGAAGTKGKGGKHKEGDSSSSSSAPSLPPGGPGSPPSSSSDEGDDGRRDGIVGGFAHLQVNPPGVYFQDFELPRRVQTPGGLPVAFEPTDIDFRSAFGHNVRDRMEAGFLYQLCYWLQEAVNNTTDSLYCHTDYTPAEVEACFSHHVIFLMRLHRLAVKRYDFLETKQTDQVLAREYERTDLPAANQHRGYGMRVFRQQRDEYRVKNAAKLAAAQSAEPRTPKQPRALKRPTAPKPGGGGPGGPGGPAGGGGEGGDGGRRPSKGGGRAPRR